MAEPIEADYTQQFLLPPALEDWVPADHPARFVREVVEAMDVEAMGFTMPKCQEGRPPYGTKLLLKLWLCGYLLRVRTSRKLEAACREQLSLLWLAGLEQPDHNSLWRFWQRNQGAMREVFRQTVHLAVRSGCVGLVLQAVDGTKVAAACSNRTGWTQAQLKKLQARLDEAVDEVQLQVAKENAPEETAGYRLPAGLTARAALREQVQAGLAQLAEEKRGHYHPSEPEARRMKVGGEKRFAYNAQAVTDAKAGIIVAEDVTREETDVGQLAPMISAAQANVGVAASTTETLADRGYGAGADLQQAHVAGLKVLVPPAQGKPAKDNPYAATRFHYDATARTVTCPLGRTLEREGASTKHGHPMERYRCHHHDCPVRAQCSRDPKGRHLDVYAHTPIVQAMRAQLAQPEVAARHRRRAPIAERIFAGIKQHDGFRRFTQRGLAAARAQWAMVCAAANLRVLHRRWQTVRHPAPAPAAPAAALAAA
jgi:transposase